MKITSTIAAAFAAIALASTAHAAKIAGKIDFGVTATLNTNNLGTATQVATWNNTFVTLGTLDFQPVEGFAATFTNGWNFNSGISPLWTVGGFTFNLGSAVVTQQSPTFLNVVGSGKITKLGFDETDGTFSFSITNQGGGDAQRFSFVSSTSTPVPDGGTSVALLGLSILGLGGVSRFVRRK